MGCVVSMLPRVGRPQAQSRIVPPAELLTDYEITEDLERFALFNCRPLCNCDGSSTTRGVVHWTVTHKLLRNECECPQCSSTMVVHKNQHIKDGLAVIVFTNFPAEFFDDELRSSGGAQFRHVEGRSP